jgi:uncharacterized protein DUF4082
VGSVSNGWGGADPSTFNDPATDYELGTRYLANEHVTINQVRVWAPATSTALANRRGYVRSTGDVILGTAVLPDSLPSGWSTYDLDAPVDVAAGTSFWVTYGTQDDYGAVLTALPQTSGDGALTANLGGFNGTVGNLPTTNGSNFFGIDVTYDVIPATGPTVSVSATVDGLTASATLTVDDDFPATVTYVIEWGDGQSDGVSTLGPHDHAYAAGGVYPILVTATDADGQTDAAVTVVRVAAPGPLDISTIMQGLADALDTIPGLRAYGWPLGKVSPPAAIVAFPESITYDATYGRGSDTLRLQVVVLSGRPTERQSRDTLAGFMAGAGSASVKATLEAAAIDTVDVLRVVSADSDVYEQGGDKFLAAIFDIDIIGSGG